MYIYYNLIYGDGENLFEILFKFTNKNLKYETLKNKPFSFTI